MQEIPQIHTVVQQQTHKLRLVANQSCRHSPVEVTGLEGSEKAGKEKLIRRYIFNQCNDEGSDSYLSSEDLYVPDMI